ncbi:hypothetical protein B0H11DRAFT_2334119 [Mycena galericulata]|nr:hypothetical protein B0H11DRAFT_2334119 [Mycena galericulata]
MMLYQRTLLLIPFLLSARHTSSAPLEGRVDTACPLGPPTYKVLVQSPTVPAAVPSALPSGTISFDDFVCSQDQISYLQQGLADARTLAEAASKALSNPTKASKSEAVTSFLGSITADTLKTQVQLRYTNVANSLSSPTLEQTYQIDKSGTDKSVYFLCATGPGQDTASQCTMPKSQSFAITGNLGFGDYKGDNVEEYTSITLCPNFFNKAQLATDVASYLDKKKRYPRGLYTFTSPTMGFSYIPFSFPGMVLLHESQHCLAIMQSEHKEDNLDDDVDLQAPDECSSNKVSATKKQDNAENFALLGFLAYADPGRFTPPPTP